MKQQEVLMKKVALLSKSQRVEKLIEKYGIEFELIAKVNANQANKPGHTYLLRSVGVDQSWQGWVNDSEATVNEI
jgi:hypothetical protein